MQWVSEPVVMTTLLGVHEWMDLVCSYHLHIPAWQLSKTDCGWPLTNGSEWCCTYWAVIGLPKDTPAHQALWCHLDLSLGCLPDPSCRWSPGQWPPSEQVAWPTPQWQWYTTCWPLGTSRHTSTLGPRWWCTNGNDDGDESAADWFVTLRFMKSVCLCFNSYNFEAGWYWLMVRVQVVCWLWWLSCAVHCSTVLCGASITPESLHQIYDILYDVAVDEDKTHKSQCWTVSLWSITLVTNAV